MTALTALETRAPLTRVPVDGRPPVPALAIERRKTSRRTTPAQPEIKRRRRALARAKTVLATAARLGFGVTLIITLIITGGSFGLFAFIGIPILAVGLGLITMDDPADSRR